MLKYVLKKLGAHVTVDIVSSMMTLMKTIRHRLFRWWSRLEQSIIADDLPAKKESIDNHIQNDGVLLSSAVVSNYWVNIMLKLQKTYRRAIRVMDTTRLTRPQLRPVTSRFTNEDFDETYYGFENHQGQKPSSDDQNRWDRLSMGNGNNEEKVGEVFIIRMSLVPTSTGLSSLVMPIWLIA